MRSLEMTVQERLTLWIVQSESWQHHDSDPARCVDILHCILDEAQGDDAELLQPPLVDLRLV